MEAKEEKGEEHQREAVELLTLQDHRPDACGLTVLIYNKHQTSASAFR